MKPCAFLRQAVCSLLFGLAAAGACAEDKLYEGMLLPEDFAGPITVTVELRDLHGVLVGRVKASPPISAVGQISSGEMMGDKCDFTVPFSSSMVLRFVGTCSTSMFEGRYTQAGRRDASSRGTFRLMRKEPDKDEDKQDGPRPTVITTSVTDCINANSRCLMACPQGDYNTEFLCSNRCRTGNRAPAGAAVLGRPVRGEPAFGVEQRVPLLHVLPGQVHAVAHLVGQVRGHGAQKGANLVAERQLFGREGQIHCVSPLDPFEIGREGFPVLINQPVL